MKNNLILFFSLFVSLNVVGQKVSDLPVIPAISPTNLVLIVNGTTTYQTTLGRILNWTNSGGVLIPSPAVDVVSITSQLADNATNSALVVDTVAPWVSNARLLDLRNNGTNTYGFEAKGTFKINGPTLSEINLTSPNGSFINAYNDDIDVWLWMSTPASFEVMNLHPTVASTGSAVAYKFDTSNTLLTGDNIATFGNHGTNQATINNLGAITAGDPGGGSGTWMLGKESIISTVTNIIIMVDGVKYSVIATPR